jgi:TM2 domain-containing membrane protein YozV
MNVTVESLEVDCPYCAEKINKLAKKCKHCHEILDQTMRELESLKAHKKDIYVTNNAASSASSTATSPAYRTQRKSKGTTFLLALLLGAIGAHRFYLGQPFIGLIYLCLCWTGITLVVSLAEAVYFFFLKNEDFDAKYNR